VGGLHQERNVWGDETSCGGKSKNGHGIKVKNSAGMGERGCRGPWGGSKTNRPKERKTVIVTRFVPLKNRLEEGTGGGGRDTHAERDGRAQGKDCSLVAVKISLTDGQEANKKEKEL